MVKAYLIFPSYQHRCASANQRGDLDIPSNLPPTKKRLVVQHM